MENFPASSPPEEKDDEQLLTGEARVYPPKYIKQEQPSNIWIRSLLSLALYLVMGYYIFPSYTILLLITAIVMIHEMGHFLAMKFYHYKDLGIFFIPLLGAYVSGTKREVSQKQSAVILLAGPLPGIAAGIIFFLVDQGSPGHYLFDISYSRIALIFIFLNGINLLPVYPLDGGQLLNRVFLDEDGFISKLFVFLSIALLTWLAIKLPFYALLLFPAMMLLRLIGDKKIGDIEKKIAAENINTDLSYEELPDRDYWAIRNILIENHPAFREIASAPPYEYHEKEEKIMTMLQSLLHRSLIQDTSLAGKIFILLIWIAALVSPWLLKMDLSFLHRFGI